MAAVGFALPSAIAGDEVNLIDGGSFEKYGLGETPSGFNIGFASGVITDAAANSGEKSLLVTYTSGNQPAVNYNAPLLSGKSYRLSAYVKLISPADTNIGFILRVADYADVYFGQRGTATVNSSQGFVKIETVVEMSTANAVSRINLFPDATAGVAYYIDDLSCVEVIPDPELVTDGDFEDAAIGTALPTAYGDVGTYAVPYGIGIVTGDEWHSGSQSLKVTKNQADDIGLNYFLPLKNGKTYYFSVWVKTDSQNSGNSSFYIRMSDTTFNWNDRGTTGGMAPGSDWVKMYAVYTPDRDYSKARLNIGFTGANGSVAYMDGVSCQIIEIDPMITPSNKLADGSFELPEFIRVMPNSITSGTGTVTTDYAHRGTHSLKVQHDGNTTNNSLGINYTGITLTKGKTYRFGAWTRFAPDTSAANLSFYIRFMGSTELAAVTGDALTPESDFTYIGVTYTVPNSTYDNDITGARLNLGMNAMGGAAGYIDDITFEEVTPVSAVAGNIISNPSFETFIRTPKNYVTSSNAVVDFVDAYDPDYVNGGQYALKVSQGASSPGSVILKASVQPGTTYNFGAMVRLDKGTEGSTRIYAHINNDGNLTFTPSISGNSEYQLLEKTYTVPDGVTEMNVQIKADTGSGSEGRHYTYYIDDVYLVPAGVEVGGSKLWRVDVEGDWYSADYTDSTAGRRVFEVKDIKNNEAAAVNIGAYIAVYSGGRLINAGANVEPVAAGGTLANINAEVTVPENVTDFKLKTFIWNADTQKPIQKPLKLLFVGNSITYHGANSGVGWTGNWGMAASERSKDYVHLLTAEARKLSPDLVMDYVNIAEIERLGQTDGSFANTASLVSQKFGDKTAFGADIIIFTIGANVNYASGFTPADYAGIVSAFNPNGKAKVIAGVTVLTSDDVKDVITSYASSYNKPLVDMHTGFNKTEHPEYFPVKTPGFYENVSVGVLGHPGDAGMAAMADLLKPALETAMRQLGV
jgi:alpha-galactosidase